MVEIIPIVIFSIWLFQATIQALNWAYWLQVKEYRFDRFEIFVLSQSGRRNLYFWLILIKFVLFGIYFLTSFFNWVIVIFIIVLDLIYLRDILRLGFRRPVFTQRMTRILFVCCIISALGLGISIGRGDLLTSIFFAEIGLMSGIFIGTLITQLISDKIKEKEKKMAQEVLKKFEPTVIGIAGSYGKSTTKEFVATILSRKYKVVKTYKNENTEFGIVRSVVSQIKNKVDYFVCEIGAYKKGEIGRICEIVAPKIGIVTGIDYQHQALFGDLENIKKAKFEIIEALPHGALAIFNLSNKHCSELYKNAKQLKTHLQVYGYSGVGSDSLEDLSDAKIKVISADFDRIKFEISIFKEKRILVVKVPGIHFLENLSCAILTSRLLGVSWEKIEDGLQEIQLPEKTMILHRKGNSVIIDDSYNASYKGFIGALAYLSLFKNYEKVVVTGGVIELGSDASELHTNLGREMTNVDRVYMTSEDFANEVRVGMGEKSKNLKVVINPNDLKKTLSELGAKKCVYLFEGKMPKVVQDLIIK